MKKEKILFKAISESFSVISNTIMLLKIEKEPIGIDERCSTSMINYRFTKIEIGCRVENAVLKIQRWVRMAFIKKRFRLRINKRHAAAFKL